jgi:hypothetical protein
MQNDYYIHQAQAVQNTVIILPENLQHHSSSRNFEYDYSKLGSIHIKGIIQKPGIRKIQKRLDVWQKAMNVYNSNLAPGRQAEKKQFVMITLTLPAKQKDTDEMVKLKILKPFIQSLIRYYHIQNWIWKAEKQINGNIHFHVVIDQYIPYAVLYSIHQSNLTRTGYITDFEKRNKGTKAPHTCVTGQKNMKSPINYILKYITKNESKEKVTGCLWRCSRTLIDLKEFVVYPTYEELINLEYSKKNDEIRYYEEKYFQLYIYPKPVVLSSLFPSCQYDIFQYYANICLILFPMKINIVKSLADLDSSFLDTASDTSFDSSCSDTTTFSHSHFSTLTPSPPAPPSPSNIMWNYKTSKSTSSPSRYFFVPGIV